MVPMFFDNSAWIEGGKVGQSPVDTNEVAANIFSISAWILMQVKL